jgi:DNA-binding transcriptional LysR family regulator
MNPSLHIPVHALRYVTLVAETRSYKTAAEQARRTQPALSLAIKQLEEVLGQPLFEPLDRTKLTAFGEACLQPIKDQLAHHDKTVDTLCRIARHEHHTVTLACVPTASTHLVPTVLPAFLEKFPQVGVSLLDDNSSNIEAMVLNSRVDFGVCSVRTEDPQLIFEPLIQDRYGIICARNHPLAKRKNLKWKELSGLPLIGSVAFELLKKAPAMSMLPEPKVRVWNMMSLLAMIEANRGVTILATLTIPPSYTDRIAFVPITGPIAPRKVGILRLAGRTLSVPSLEMIALIRAHVQARMSEYAAISD